MGESLAPSPQARARGGRSLSRGTPRGATMKIQDQTTRTRAELGVAGAGPSGPRPQAPEAPRPPRRRPAGARGRRRRCRCRPAAGSSTGRWPRPRRRPTSAQDKVADVRRRLESGTYVIDPTRIARGILDVPGLAGPPAPAAPAPLGRALMTPPATATASSKTDRAPRRRRRSSSRPSPPPARPSPTPSSTTTSTRSSPRRGTPRC